MCSPESTSLVSAWRTWKMCNTEHRRVTRAPETPSLLGMKRGKEEIGNRVRIREERRTNATATFIIFLFRDKRCQVSRKNVSSALLVKLCGQSFKTCKRIIKTKQLQCTAYQILHNVAYFVKRRLLLLVMSFSPKQISIL